MQVPILAVFASGKKELEPPITPTARISASMQLYAPHSSSLFAERSHVWLNRSDAIEFCLTLILGTTICSFPQNN
jgi:hypothetical protein